MKPQHHGPLACPQCHGRAATITDTRGVFAGTAVRRRRTCVACRHRWTTYEMSGSPRHTTRAVAKLRAALVALGHTEAA